MPSKDSVFHALLHHVPWAACDRLVEEHGADARVRRFSTRNQLIVLLYGQFAGATSLREIETALASHQGRFSSLAVGAVARSILADANARRPCATFAGLLALMMGQVRPGLGRATRYALSMRPDCLCPRSALIGRAFRAKPAGPRRTSSTIPTPTGCSISSSRRPG